MTNQHGLIVKTDNGGYDGKGQWDFADVASIYKHDFRKVGTTEFIIEERIELAYECSVFIARNRDVEAFVSPAVRNVHTNRYGGGILHYSWWTPEAIPRKIAERAQAYAQLIAHHLNLIDGMTVEFFVTTDGQLLLNEIAPRVHNSFHGSKEAAGQSQFTQSVAAKVGLPLQPMKFDRPWAMFNLIGAQIDLIPTFFNAGWHVDDYGKVQAGEGRKMGHVTYVGNSVGEVQRAIDTALVHTNKD